MFTVVRNLLFVPPTSRFFFCFFLFRFRFRFNFFFLKFHSIELPQGGATAASPFVCKNVGGLPCIEGLHLQDCIAEGTWGNESPHFGYNLSRLWNLAFVAFLAYSACRLCSDHFEETNPKTP